MVPQISGRVVNSLDDITVQEVPTDGTVALFPSEYNAIVAKIRSLHEAT